MFAKIGNGSDPNIIEACCSCGCGCTCDPISAEGSGRTNAAGSVSRRGASTNSTPSA